MSDSTKDTRQRARRGSLLDHAGDAPSLRPSGSSRAHAAATPARPVPSLLAAPARGARLSTSRQAAGHSAIAEEAATATPPVESSPIARNDPGAARTSREKFGDRIARLIGDVGAAQKPAAARGSPPPAAAQSAPQAAAEPRAAAAPPTPPREDRFPAGPGSADRAPPRDDQAGDDHYHWHAAELGDDSRPLLDASILVSAVWRYRIGIGAATVAGAVLGVALALSTPHKYYAESRLFVDPREIRVTEDDIRNQQLSTEAMLAITDSQLQILTSTSVLEKVIAYLGLDRDPEFSGSLPSGGIRGGLSLIKDIFISDAGPSEVEQKALQNLREAVSATRDSKTFVIILGVNTRDPEKSAIIANKIIETYLASEGQAQSNLLERTSESIDTRLNALRSDLDAAERAVEKYKADNGLVGVAGQFIDDKVILALSDQLANARAMKVGIKVKADNLAKVRLDDVLSGAFPEELLSTNLTELRKQYTQAKANADSLATRLGPRHPQYIAAKSSLDTITSEIGAELRRIVASSQNELQRAVETEQELASQMAVAKTRAVDQSVDFVTLRELERKANATRGIYEAFLTRSRETSERSNLSTRNIRVISPAEAPLLPTGPSRKLIVIGGALAGFLAGVGLAIAAGAVESIRAYNTGPAQARFQTPPFGGYPPAPAPRTPPDSPPRRSWFRRDDDVIAGFDAAADQATAAGPARAPARSDRQEPAPAPLARQEPVAPLRDDSGVMSDDAAPRPTDTDQTGAAVGHDAGHRVGQAETAERQQQAPLARDRDESASSGPSTATPGQNDRPMTGQPAMPQQMQPPHPAMPQQMQTPQPAMPQQVETPQPGLSPAAAPDPRMPQPLWTAYPAQALPPHQLPPQFNYPVQSGPVADPHSHAAGHPQMWPGHPALYAGHPVPQPQMTPPQPYTAQPYVQPQPPAMPPQAYAEQPGMARYPAQAPMPYPVQQPAAAPQAAPVWPQPVPAPVWPQAQPVSAPWPQPSAPWGTAAPQPFAAPAQPAPVMQPPQPARNEAVDRIRRDMDTLKSRIAEYGSARRHA